MQNFLQICLIDQHPSDRLVLLQSFEYEKDRYRQTDRQSKSKSEATIQTIGPRY